MSDINLEELVQRADRAYNSGAFSESRRIWEEILAADPANLEALFGLTETCHQLGLTDAPLAALERARTEAPRNEDLLILYIDALIANQDHLVAFELAHEGVKTFPQNANLRIQVGRGCMAFGEPAKAREHLWAAHKLAPDNASALYYLARIGDKKDFEPLATKLAEELWPKPLDPGVELLLSFSRAFVAEKQGRYEDAWVALADANEISRQLVFFDESGFVSVVAGQLQLFANASPPAASNDAAGRNLVFIVSLPRSGSTLTEQILASHSRVRTIGERRFVADAFQLWKKNRTPAGLEEARESYLENAFAAAGCPQSEGTTIVDKGIANYLFVGFLRMLFPGARFVHVVRDPMDAAFSCYASIFGPTALKWCGDLGTIGRVFRRYQKLMKTWMRQDRDDLLTMAYEDLTSAPEARVRELLEFCGLPWEPACLDFHENKRQVSTASVAQVRRPIYKTAQGRAVPFEAHLEPLRRALGRAASPDWYKES